MSSKPEDHRLREPQPRPRLGPTRDAVFFPGEVARLLQLNNIDYDQLRRMWVLAHAARGEAVPSRRWARFTLRDLAATEVVVGLAGRRDRLATSRHLNFRGIAETCEALRVLGFDDPLIQVPMIRDGSRILAQVGEYVIVPTTNQMALDYASDMVEEYIKSRTIEDQEVRDAIRDERRRSRARRHQLALKGGRGAIPLSVQQASSA